MSLAPLAAPVSNDPGGFIDAKSVDWKQVRRTRYWIYQRFHYDYPGSVRELRQRLMVVPNDQHGHQRLHSYKLQVSAPVETSEAGYDAFGNRVFRLHVPEVADGIDFEVWSSIEHVPQPGVLPHVPARLAQHYLTQTPLTTCDARLAEAARELGGRGLPPEQLAEAISDWTYAAMRYGWGITHVGTTAAEALALGTGVCQDYAHIMLALCRSNGLPARYVSGHLLGEGGSHAWVEVLLPDPQCGDLRALAIDPTNRCRAGLTYITIAVGRDYRDVSPTTGSFIAPFGGHLTASKKAGLTVVEYNA